MLVMSTDDDDGDDGVVVHVENYIHQRIHRTWVSKWYRTHLQSLTVNCAQLGASPSGLHTGCPDTEMEGLHKHTIANTTERMT